ncbi:MAG: putative porin, partial [Bacteroidales bacterium]|nr:putative porin [Bacteroidales bacterium]
MHFKNSGFLLHFVFGIFLLMFVLPAKAQRDQRTTTIDSTQVKYFNRSFDSLFLGVTHQIDTAIGTFTQFDALSKGNDVFLTLSNAGAPHKKIVFAPLYFGTFDVNQHVFSQYLKSSNEVRYLDPMMPFTELNYLMGSKKEQHLNASFNRQISPRLFIGMEYFLVSSPGIYKNNKIENNSVYFTSRYSTKNQKYGVLAHYFHNKLTMGENG